MAGDRASEGRRPNRQSSVNTPGGDLVVPPGPGIPKGIVVAAADLHERFSKASGPGGQGVNTTDSRVELVLDITAATSFTPAQHARLLATLGEAVTIVAAENRSQYRNRVAARARLAARLRAALAPDPAKRRPTKPTRGSQARRLRGKRQRSDTKRLRGPVTGEE